MVGNAPANAFQIFNAIFARPGNATVEERSRKKIIGVVSQTLHTLCEKEVLKRINVNRRGYYYGLPDWLVNDTLKSKYQIKLSNNLVNISVALVDDQVLFRKALKALLTSLGNITVLYEVDTGPVLVRKMGDGLPVPDICFFSSLAFLPDNNQTLKIIRKKFKSLKVLILATYFHDFTINKIIRDGANEYLNKDYTPEELKKALLKIYTEKYYWDNIPAGFNEPHNKKRFQISVPARQQTFLSWCATDLSYEEIAKKMGKAPRTIDGYRDIMFRRFKVVNRVSLNIFSIKNGLIDMR